MSSKWILITLILTALLMSCRLTGIKGNGDLTNELREVDKFTKVDVSGNFDVQIDVGQPMKIEIIAESNLMEYIKTKVNNDVLYISSIKNLRPRKDLKISITCPELTAIVCSGVNDVLAEGIDSDEFDIDLSGAGSINISGRAAYFMIDVSGAADLMAKNFISENVSIDVSGAANAEVYASNSCRAEVSGAGFIELYGDAKDVSMDISGAGSLERR